MSHPDGFHSPTGFRLSIALADDLGFSGHLRDIVAQEMILDAEQKVEAGVGEKGFPVVLRPALLYRRCGVRKLQWSTWIKTRGIEGFSGRSTLSKVEPIERCSPALPTQLGCAPISNAL
jgi:hypothetical protein